MRNLKRVCASGVKLLICWFVRDGNTNVKNLGERMEYMTNHGIIMKGKKLTITPWHIRAQDETLIT